MNQDTKKAWTYRPVLTITKYHHPLEIVCVIAWLFGHIEIRLSLIINHVKPVYIIDLVANCINMRYYNFMYSLFDQDYCR